MAILPLLDCWTRTWQSVLLYNITQRSRSMEFRVLFFSFSLFYTPDNLKDLCDSEFATEVLRLKPFLGCEF